MNPRKVPQNCGIFSYRGAYSLQNLLDKKKEVFVNKEYVRPFNHRTAPQQYGGLRLYPGCYPGLGASGPSGRVGVERLLYRL